MSTCRRASTNAVAEDELRPESPSRPRALGGIVLVVEDEPGLRRLVGATLEARGYRVLEAANGSDALEIAAREPGIDLLLTDVIMARPRGTEIAERLCRLSPRLKVIFMSGYPHDGKDDTPEHAAFMRKPFRLSELGYTVDRVMSEANA